MIQTSAQAASTLAVWEQFMSTGDLEPGVLRPEVEASWTRCLEAGVNPFADKATAVLSPAAFAALAERKRELIQVAKPFMEELFRLVAGSSFVVLLFDERGILLETVGDPGNIRRNPDLNLEPGALWSEEEVGTNGAGTAMVLGRPFQVSGPEHFCRKHHGWTCSGAPIHDPRGGIIGILDLSGPVDATHLHTLGLVMAAVAAIRNALDVGRRNQELVLLNNHLSSILGTVTEGILVLDAEGRLRQINPVAERMLGMADHHAAGMEARDLVARMDPVLGLLEEGLEFLDQELDLHSGRGVLRCMASGKPILDEAGAVRGAVLFVNPIQKIQSLVNRFTGAQATFRFEDILGEGEALRRALRLGRQAAGNDSNVLLQGESGTGKEMFAQAIHHLSARRQGPFVAVNCGAIPRELIASELFGYQEGAFTGAARGGRPGKFELAAGGTLFLDEIGDMPLEQQVALLRVLQDRTITRIGGDRPHRVDVRIICATHKDLFAEAGRGTFRQDLYYRLNVSPIRLPALREHPEDIPLLLEAFLRTSAHPRPARVEPGVARALASYPWPGNIREFQNVVERMVLASQGGPLTPDHLPEEIRPLRARPALPAPPGPSAPAGFRARREAQEKAEILDALQARRGNLSQAAQDLGISRNTLYRRIAKHGI